MGISESTVSSSRLAELEQRINSLDRNRDGVVTRNELDQWTRSLEEKIETKYSSQLADREKELESAKLYIEQLENQIAEIKKSQPGPEHGSRAVHHSDDNVVQLSKARINQWIEEMLANKGTNIKYLPDFVERMIYRNVLNMGINLMDRAVDSVHFQFLGHQLVFDIEPQPENPVERDLNIEKASANSDSSYDTSQED